jgi:hypothetical protein
MKSCPKDSYPHNAKIARKINTNIVCHLNNEKLQLLKFFNVKTGKTINFAI